MGKATIKGQLLWLDPATANHDGTCTGDTQLHRVWQLQLMMVSWMIQLRGVAGRLDWA